MLVVIACLQLPDGRVFEHHGEVEERYQDGQVYWWTQGNANCDCNRSLFLNREYHLNLRSVDDDEAWPCGDLIDLLWLDIDGVRAYTKEAK